MSRPPSKPLIALGGAVAVAGGAVTWAAARSVAQNQAVLGLGSPVVLVTLLMGLLGLVATCWGVLTILASNRGWVRDGNVQLIVALVLTPLLGEGFLRAGIAFGPDVFRNPRLYRDAYSNDDFFKLSEIWEVGPSEHEGPPGWPIVAYDARLGWSYPRTEDNPLGIVASLPYEQAAGRRPILFFGDSFVAYGRMEGKIPQLMDALLPEQSVYNFGVAGYGLDQILLRFEEEHGGFSNPLVLFGLLTVDMDRTVLRFRNRPKPYFDVVEGELILRGVPVPADLERYLEENPPELRSFFFAALGQAIAYLGAGTSLDLQARREEKEAITAAIIERAVRSAKEAGLEVVFVLFESGRRGGKWRKAFLIDQLERWDARYVDTERLIDEAVHSAPTDPPARYDKTGHHTPWANRAIAAGIADYIAPLLAHP